MTVYKSLFKLSFNIHSVVSFQAHAVLAKVGYPEFILNDTYLNEDLKQVCITAYFCKKVLYISWVKQRSVGDTRLKQTKRNQKTSLIISVFDLAAVCLVFINRTVKHIVLCAAPCICNDTSGTRAFDMCYATAKIHAHLHLESIYCTFEHFNNSYIYIFSLSKLYFSNIIYCTLTQSDNATLHISTHNVWACDR